MGVLLDTKFFLFSFIVLFVGATWFGAGKAPGLLDNVGCEWEDVVIMSEPVS